MAESFGQTGAPVLDPTDEGGVETELRLSH